jgi:hypothetical protein
MGLSLSGIIFLTLAWGVITALVIYCFTKVIISERKTNGN